MLLTFSVVVVVYCRLPVDQFVAVVDSPFVVVKLDKVADVAVVDSIDSAVVYLAVDNFAVPMTVVEVVDSADHNTGLQYVMFVVVVAQVSPKIDIDSDLQIAAMAAYNTAVMHPHYYYPKCDHW